MSQPEEKRVVSLPTDAGKPQEEKKSRAKPAKVGPGHSDIFDRLSAADETDLVGLVAYGLYQRQKRAWIAAYQEKHGRFPIQEERDAHAFSYREGGLLALRADAEGALAAFAEQVVEEQIETLRADALSLQTQAVLTGIDTKIEKLGGYRHHVFGHLLAFSILVGIVAFGTFIIQFEPSVKHAYQWLFGTVQPADPGGRGH